MNDDLRRLFTPRPDWFDDAACRGMGPDLFFPSQGEDGDMAKQVCASCPVAAQCNDYAINGRERFGVWGGNSERVRRRYKSAGTARANNPVHGTEAGYRWHRRWGVPACQECRDAHNAVNRARLVS